MRFRHGADALRQLINPRQTCPPLSPHRRPLRPEPLKRPDLCLEDGDARSGPQFSRPLSGDPYAALVILASDLKTRARQGNFAANAQVVAFSQDSCPVQGERPSSLRSGPLFGHARENREKFIFSCSTVEVAIKASSKRRKRPCTSLSQSRPFSGLTIGFSIPRPEQLAIGLSRAMQRQ